MKKASVAGCGGGFLGVLIGVYFFVVSVGGCICLVLYLLVFLLGFA